MLTATNNQRFMNPLKILKDAGLSEGMKVADLGSGSGYFSVAAAKITGEKGRVYAVDCLESALESVRAKADIEGAGEIISLIRGNLEAERGTGMQGNSIDVAILKNVLFQSQNREAILKEAYRILALKGKLLLIEWESSKMPIGPGAGYKVDKEEVKKMAVDLEFKVSEEFQADGYHYGIIFIK